MITISHPSFLNAATRTIVMTLYVLRRLLTNTALAFDLTTLASFGISTPSFLLGLGGLYLLGRKLGLFPIRGMAAVAARGDPNGHGEVAHGSIYSIPKPKQCTNHQVPLFDA